MFVWLNLIAIAWLLLGMSAHADDPEYLRFSADPTRVAFRIPIPTPAGCEHSVSEMLFPSDSIKAGLDQLAALNENQSNSTAKCLQEAFQGWDTVSYERLALEASGTPTTDEDGSPLPSAQYRKLGELHRCLELPDGSGAVPPGCKVITPAEDWKKLEGAWKQESDEYNARVRKWMDLRSKIENILSNLPPLLNFEPAELQRLTTKSVCHRNPDPIQFAKDQESKSLCTGIWQDDYATTEERARMRELGLQHNNAKSEKFIRQAALKLFLGQPSSESLIQQSGLIELLDQLKCANEAEPGTFRYANFRRERSAECEGHWLSANQIKELHEKFLAKAQPLLAASAKWNAGRMETLPQRQQAFDKAHATEIEQYASKRLMALFSAFLSAGGKLSETSTFCSGYVQRMKADSEFFRSAPDFFRQYNSLAYNRGSAWEHAANYGLTEADLAATAAYTGSYFSQINPALLGQTPLTADMAKFKVAFDHALKRLPTYDAGPVLRFATLPAEVLQKHQVGEIVCYPNYTSTSRDPAWQWGGAHKMVIYPGEKSHLLETVSNLKKEQEVLFEAGACFKVLGRTQGKVQEVDLVLAEVDKSGHVIAKIPSQEQP